jgi:hypothetical protein
VGFPSWLREQEEHSRWIDVEPIRSAPRLLWRSDAQLGRGFTELAPDVIGPVFVNPRGVVLAADGGEHAALLHAETGELLKPPAAGEAMPAPSLSATLERRWSQYGWLSTFLADADGLAVSTRDETHRERFTLEVFDAMGSKLWETVGDVGFEVLHPEHCVAAAYGRDVVLIDRRTGVRQRVLHRRADPEMVGARDVVYLVEHLSSTIAAVSFAGELLWRLDLEPLGGAHVFGMAPSHGRLYVGAWSRDEERGVDVLCLEG